MYLSSPLVFVALFSTLCTLWLLVADMIGMVHFLPIPWPKFVSISFIIFSWLSCLKYYYILFLCSHVNSECFPLPMHCCGSTDSFFHADPSPQTASCVGWSPHRRKPLLSIYCRRELDHIWHDHVNPTRSIPLLYVSFIDSKPGGWIAGVSPMPVDFVRTSLSRLL